MFSHYVGESLDIVPKNICHDVIGRILNLVHYDGYYSDKNNFDRFFPYGFMPKTILRRMNDFCYNAAYQSLQINKDTFKTYLEKSGFQRIVVKPSLDTGSGRGVKLAEYRKGIWF